LRRRVRACALCEPDACHNRDNAQRTRKRSDH
jgi:hypothetical protein